MSLARVHSDDVVVDDRVWGECPSCKAEDCLHSRTYKEDGKDYDVEVCSLCGWWG